MSSYFHLMEGRLRIKVIEIKGRALRATEVERILRRIDGVSEVKANPTTGNVLVLFNQDRTDHDKIVDTLKMLGCLRRTHQSTLQRSPSLMPVLAERMAQRVLETVIETTLHRLLLALI